MKKWIAIGILAVLVIGMVLLSGCTSLNTQSVAPVYTPLKTLSPTPSNGEEIVISNGDYTAHGLRFHVNLEEKGDKITYKNMRGDTDYLLSNTGEQLLKFSITTTSTDGKQSFYWKNFFIMDDNGISYGGICPMDNNNNCKNSDNLMDMLNPISEQKNAGLLIYSVPKNTNHVSLIYNGFTESGNPQVIKFNQILIPPTVVRETPESTATIASTSTQQITSVIVPVTPTPTLVTSAPIVTQAQDPIIGVWRCSDSSGYDHRYRFNADHTFVESFDFGGTLGTTISKGTWRSEGHNSYITVDDEFKIPDTVIYSPSRNAIYSKDIPTFVLSPYAGDVKAAT